MLAVRFEPDRDHKRNDLAMQPKKLNRFIEFDHQRVREGSVWTWIRTSDGWLEWKKNSHKLDTSFHKLLT